MFSVVNIDESDKWDKIVKNFKKYDIYYLSGYTKAFQIHGDGEPILFYYMDDNIRAINVSMKKDISETEYYKGIVQQKTFYDLSTPYGYGGFIIEGECYFESVNKLNEEYTNFCSANNIVCEFVRFHPLINNADTLNNMYGETTLGETVSIDLSTTEIIWNNFTSKNRNMIRKAIKNGVQIFWGQDWNLYYKFIEMYNKTMDKDNATSYYYFKECFYESILNDLKYNSLIFYAVYESKIIAMAIILFANSNMHYHLSASVDEYKYLASTNLLLYEAACWGCENGYNNFHLGGGLGSREDSLYKFKKAFNRDSHNNFCIGKKIFNEDKYRELVVLRKFSNESDNMITFFPKYRAVY